MIEYRWEDLNYEINNTIDLGLPVEFWWRNDGAVSKTKELSQLSSLASNEGVSIGVSIIPERMSSDIIGHFEDLNNIFILQNGFKHINYAPSSEQKIELGKHRPIKNITRELKIGHNKLYSAFNSNFLPILVPPWNRISSELVSCLPSLGFHGLSCYKPRSLDFQVSNIVQINTHIDLIDWSGNKRFIGTGAALALACQHLSNKREGRVDPSEPTGLLTHHLLMDFPSWAFVGAFVRRTKSISGVKWKCIPEVFDKK